MTGCVKFSLQYNEGVCSGIVDDFIPHRLQAPSVPAASSQRSRTRIENYRHIPTCGDVRPFSTKGQFRSGRLFLQATKWQSESMAW